MVNWRMSPRAQHFRKMLQERRERRESLNLSQTELARRLGISQSGVSNLEKGNTRFDIFWTEEVCVALELDPMDFLRAYEATAPGGGRTALGPPRRRGSRR